MAEQLSELVIADYKDKFNTIIKESGNTDSIPLN